MPKMIFRDFQTEADAITAYGLTFAASVVYGNPEATIIVQAWRPGMSHKKHYSTQNYEVYRTPVRTIFPAFNGRDYLRENIRFALDIPAINIRTAIYKLYERQSVAPQPQEVPT